MPAFRDPDLQELQQTAEALNRQCVVGAVIFDRANRVLAPRRSAMATAMPSIWDLVGGHVEPGESLLQALSREVTEETGWTVRGSPRLVFVSDWQLPGGPPTDRREFDFVVEVEGDLASPRLAPEEHVSYRWVAHDDFSVFDENGGVDDGLVRRTAEAAFALHVGQGLRRPHATVFFNPPPAEIEALRSRWDPVMAAHIPAHVTVVYPSEVGDHYELISRVEHAAQQCHPFQLVLNEVVHEGDSINGVFVRVEDREGGWVALS